MSDEKKQVDTGGGAHVGGNVTVTGGDFVGRDQIKITTGLSADEVAQRFKELYAAVEKRPRTTPEDRADLKAELQELQAEVVKGEDADEGFLARRLRNIGRAAPDILEVVTATLSSPAAGFAAVVKKVAQKAKAAAGGGGA
jgi:hypothetical protein